MRSTIKVLVVDDSALIRQMLKRALSLDPTIEIVGSAKTGLEAIEQAQQLHPDVITLDIQMPELSGLEALPHIIKATPARVVMLSALGDDETTYQALAAGATDFLVKPAAGFAVSLSDLTEVLLKKIKTAYRIHPERRLAARDARREDRTHPTENHRDRAMPAARVVAIAASTGGPPALEAVFSGLTADLPAAYVIVQHLPAGFARSMASRLSRVTDIAVIEARDGMPLREGMAYLAGHGMHMRVVRDGERRLVLEDMPPQHGVRPAADPLMESVAEVYGRQSVGVVLTGMGADGAHGLRMMHLAGAETLVQDEESSVVWGMPGAAVRAGAASKVVPLREMATEIRRAIRGAERAR